MLEEGHLFLCQASKLDDPSECKTTFKLDDYVDAKTGRMSFRVIDETLKSYRPFIAEDNLKRIRELVFQAMTPDGFVDQRLLSKSLSQMKGLASENDLLLLANFLLTVPDLFNRPEVRENVDLLFSLAHQAKEEIGICSLTELADSPEMWRTYANESAGYCIQYSMEGYNNNLDLFPVIYSDKRETSIISAILKTYLGALLSGLSYGKVPIDQSHYIRLFLTKDSKWAYQKEWRIIGNANDTINAPLIQAIYLGEKVSTENKHLMKTICKEKGIPVIQR